MAKRNALKAATAEIRSIAMPRIRQQTETVSGAGWFAQWCVKNDVLQLTVTGDVDVAAMATVWADVVCNRSGFTAALVDYRKASIRFESDLIQGLAYPVCLVGRPDQKKPLRALCNQALSHGNLRAIRHTLEEAVDWALMLAPVASRPYLGPACEFA